MTDNKLTTCTLQQACNWILFAKQPEHIFESDVDTEAYDEKKHAKALLNAKKIILRGVYDDIIHPIGAKPDGCYSWTKKEPIPDLVGYQYIDIDIEQNTIFFTESPSPAKSPQLYGFVEIPFEELKKLVPEKKHLLKLEQNQSNTYSFPKDVFISEYMDIIFEILSEGKILKNKELPPVNVIQKWIEGKYEHKYPHAKKLSKRLKESLATALRSVAAQDGKAYHDEVKRTNKK